MSTSGARLRALRRCLIAAVIASGTSIGGCHESGPNRTPAAVSVTPAAPQTIVSGTTVSLKATVTTADGRVLAGTEVTWASSDSSVAVIAGIGSGATVTITGARAGSATITATAGSVTSAGVSITVTAGTPAGLALRTQPAGAVSGQALRVQPVVEIDDAAGNLVPTAAETISVALASGASMLSGTPSAMASGGLATFANLLLTGSDSASLAFSSPGLRSVTSRRFFVAPPPTLVLAGTTVSFGAVVNTPGGITKTVAVTNGGGGALTGISARAITYGAGQPTGWLSADVTNPSAPDSLVLTATPGNLPVGSYSATVLVSAADAANPPQSVTATLTILSGPASIAYGSASTKIYFMARGGSASPPVAAFDQNGNAVSTNTVSYESRSTAVATVNANGTITAAGAGSTWVVAISGAVGDSVWVLVPSATGPVLETTLSQVTWNPGDTLTLDVVLDTRGATVGGATIVVTWSADPYTGVLAYVDSRPIPGSSVAPTITVDQITGLIRLTVASATGFTGTVTLARFRFTGRVDLGSSGRAGWLYVNPQEIVGIDASNLTTQTTATRYPIIVR